MDTPTLSKKTDLLSAIQTCLEEYDQSEYLGALRRQEESREYCIRKAQAIFGDDFQIDSLLFAGDRLLVGDGLKLYYSRFERSLMAEWQCSACGLTSSSVYCGNLLSAALHLRDMKNQHDCGAEGRPPRHITTE